MIQLRRVPDEVYTAVKARADERQLSISDYLVEELTRLFGSQASVPQITQQENASSAAAGEGD
jgi:hypothetical protein